MYISLSVLSVALATITQWDNECISLLVLSVALTTITQWENECISLFVLSVALTTITQWRMNVSHCLSCHENPYLNTAMKSVMIA